MEENCSTCVKKLEAQEKIYYDIPAGSKKVLCQTCYDQYMMSLSETGTQPE